MQTIVIIAARSGASGQPALLPFGAEQPILGARGDEDGFTAVLARDGDLVGSSVTGAEVPAAALAAFVGGFPWPLPVADVTNSAASGAEGSDSALAVAGQGILPQHAATTERVVSAEASGPGLPAPPIDGAARAHLTTGDPASAVRSGVFGAVLSQGPGASLEGSNDGPPFRQGPASPDDLPWFAAESSVRRDTSPGMLEAEPNAPRDGASRSVSGDEGSTPPQDQTVIPGALTLPLATDNDAAVRTASSPASSGTDVRGVAQDAALGLDGSLPDVVRPLNGSLGRDPFTAEERPSNGSDTIQQRIDGTDDGRAGRNPLATRGLIGVLETVQHSSPASAAECLWHGAALARVAGSGTATDDPALMALPTEQGAAPFASSDPRNDSAPAQKGHSPLLAVGPSGGPVLQPPQATLWDARSDPAVDPRLPIEGGDLLDPDIALSAGFVGGTTSLLPLSAAAPTTGTQVPAALAHLSGQIATALAQRPDGATDIALSPDELGRVHMTLQADAQNPDRMVVFLSFDRPETLDLFRRHADLLAEAIRSSGYAGADISFGQSGTGAGGSFGPGAGDGGAVPENASERAATLSANAAQDTPPDAGDLTSPRHGLATVLNLRL